jgi:MinD superfamily P-loop ATPase
LSYESSAGRTLITRELFRYITSQSGVNVQAASFDFEKPDLKNCLNGNIQSVKEIYALHPVIDKEKCRYCGECAGFCPYKAIQFNRYVPSVTLIVARCTACGNCVKACSINGIKMKDKHSGKIILGNLFENKVIIGESCNSGLQVPLINAMTERFDPKSFVICDFPPGNEIEVYSRLEKINMAIIIVHPSQRWEAGLNLMLEMVSRNIIPIGIILNKVKNETTWVQQVKAKCSHIKIPILGVIPFDDNLKLITDSADFMLPANISREIKKIWNGIQNMSSETRLIRNNNTHITN